MVVEMILTSLNYVEFGRPPRLYHDRYKVRGYDLIIGGYVIVPELPGGLSIVPGQAYLARRGCPTTAVITYMHVSLTSRSQRTAICQIAKDALCLVKTDITAEQVPLFRSPLQKCAILDDRGW